MAKRLTEKQKEEIRAGLVKGKTIDWLAQKFFCTKLTIIRNLKKDLGEFKYKKLFNENKNLKNNRASKIIDNIGYGNLE